ncbi:ATP-binding protein [Streptomyces yunnanensis]|uniref:ATP-binding protein n=1 Tax=Streptomyces yunnanensis TaxID=156453 RepID=A0ABY8A0F4_9ACTN|nr:ATP-binding protein [Streptomyces yunnanensis]WEB38253.1 ATP-binding protein [Streptomyces yunnanensis]
MHRRRSDRPRGRLVPLPPWSRGTAGDTAAETSRHVAWVRLMMLVPLVPAGLQAGRSVAALPFGLLAAGYALWAVGRLLWVYRWPVTDARGAAAALVVDLTLITALAAVSGGRNSAVRYAYFMWPMATVLWQLPVVTAVFGLICVAGYTVMSVPGLPTHRADWTWSVMSDQTYLLWTVLASVVIAKLLNRRTQRIDDLLRSRELLLEDALRAESRERGDLADALHDGPVQTLTVAVQDLDEVPERAGGDLLTRIRAELRTTIGEIRGIIVDLHPQALSTKGLGPALKAMGQRCAQRGGFSVEYDIQAPTPLAHQELLYSVARELLTNVVKHARATEVSVHLRTQCGETVLAVHDNGRGFTPAVAQQRLHEGHIGLASHCARVESAGGQWQVDSAPGGPTTVEVRLPS